MSIDCTTCEWLEDEDGLWVTDCNEDFQFTSHGPSENGFEWCPYCGKKLIEIQLFGTN